MSAFDEILYGAKKCFDAAAEKTNEFIENSKIQMEKSQLHCEMKDEYVRLGRTCYQMSETGIDQTEKMKTIIAKIKALHDELERVSTAQRTPKETVCEVCGAVNASRNAYCSKCGVKLD